MSVSRVYVLSVYYPHGIFLKEIMFLLFELLDWMTELLNGILKYFAEILCIEGNVKHRWWRG